MAIKTEPSVIPEREDSTQKRSVEQDRLVGYYRPYVESASPISEIVTLQAKAAAKGAGPSSTEAASASKTMGTRKAIHGAKGTSETGVQSIKDAGKQRTQSNAPKK